jgi:N-acetylglucosamine kinase-like BadF-type ATPase
MIIIAESGSTKTNWLTADKELHETIGFNPMFFSSDNIYDELIKQEGLLKLKNKVTEVFFYGASCSSDDRKQIVWDALKKYFPNANNIKVDHDMNAAAFATCDGKPGIACILGTGSNSCVFDGKSVLEDGPTLGLGYILGDEGSGAWFGKKLLARFLYKELPEATTKILKEDYGLEKNKIYDAVYRKPHANVYLASFAKVMTDSPDNEYMSRLAEEGFTEFFEHNVCCYENYKTYPVHFVGSIAFHFKDALKKVADKYACALGIVDKNPVYRLLDYHLTSAKNF